MKKKRTINASVLESLMKKNPHVSSDLTILFAKYDGSCDNIDVYVYMQKYDDSNPMSPLDCDSETLDDAKHWIDDNINDVSDTE